MGTVLQPLTGAPSLELPPTVQGILDAPLAPVPPVLALLALLAAAVLAVRRMMATRRRERELEEAKSAFMRVASHELRTPLTVIRGYMAMASDGALAGSAEEMDQVVASLRDNVDDLYRLTELMLVAAQIDVRSVRLNKRPLDLRDEVSATVRDVSERVGSRYRLVVETDLRPVPVKADPERLRAVIVHLLDHAMRTSPTGSEIRLSVGAAGRQARIAVRDLGPVIPAAESASVFTRFGPNADGTGDGLSLYLARELTRLHGGEVRVHAADGGGNMFQVSLPLGGSFWTRLRGQRPAPAAGPALN
ncbi:MAG: HAMP domain-containing histidine kinase [Candidatus Dormibacteraeota bacterium]|nr:HAMP domain-containing histidine kinase [Candidatus Dormibacteraeota bacterium]